MALHLCELLLKLHVLALNFTEIVLSLDSCSMILKAGRLYHLNLVLHPLKGFPELVRSGIFYYFELKWVVHFLL